MREARSWALACLGALLVVVVTGCGGGPSASRGDQITSRRVDRITLNNASGTPLLSAHFDVYVHLDDDARWGDGHYDEGFDAGAVAGGGQKSMLLRMDRNIEDQLGEGARRIVCTVQFAAPDGSPEPVTKTCTLRAHDDNDLHEATFWFFDAAQHPEIRLCGRATQSDGTTVLNDRTDH
jgi:hypothetical protein